MMLKIYTPSAEPEIYLTEAAKLRMIKVIEETADVTAMRLSIKETGCSGYSYDLQGIVAPEADDLVVSLNENKTLFLYIDTKIYDWIRGLNIDYLKQGLQAKFIYQNPMQTGQCGCGVSFTVG